MGPQVDVTPADLIVAHQRDVWRFLVALGCTPDEADDLTQETFLSLLRAKFTYRGHAETAAWLRRAARNLFISSLRKRGRAILTPNLDEVESHWQAFEEECAADDRVALLRECLSQLDARDRLALELRYTRELSREEMAARLKLEPSSVRTLLHRLRRALRDCVQRKLSVD
jgi:RNA polymerase sigma-70 factor, ECF subfamily